MQNGASASNHERDSASPMLSHVRDTPESISEIAQNRAKKWGLIEGILVHSRADRRGFKKVILVAVKGDRHLEQNRTHPHFLLSFSCNVFPILFLF